ncbi:HNH endonuclease [Cupriavidus gilardii]|uniref:HNH endonuclease signature motif containing protein n=1 Tax=Cupriavidus gilardii TaxID=82541 RepID=UPI001ABD9FE2|nr:HNH endonuclease signature motif containing protein [Cupriavidus gilardii]MBO4119859.1 HNH endonuclease [Cupriavidus gilardii]MCG5259762.1 HNH endonuclease [Cupriavidus gilardii]MDF9429978.1 HNH endonuclease [Cupriavidus gilardii]
MPIKPKAIRPLTAERVRDALVYCPDTGEFTWRASSPFNRFAGKPAGCINGHGYRIILLDGRIHMAHRLAWLYVHGELPPAQIDHVNGCRGDNRIANLRLCSGAENLRNRAMHAKNKSGYKGVSFKDKKWRASIGHGGRTRHLGLFDTPAEAAHAYDAAARATFGEFARVNFPEKEA